MGPLKGLIVLSILFQKYVVSMLYLRFPVKNTRRRVSQSYFCFERRKVWNHSWQFCIIAVGKQIEETIIRIWV
jgi:uncharacterized protein (UPF0305 family)